MEKIIIKRFLSNKDYRNKQFSFSLISPSGSGKSHTINYLIKKLSKYFDNIFYFYGSELDEEGKVEGVDYKEFDLDLLTNSIDNLKMLTKNIQELNKKLKPEKRQTPPQTLLILDDCIFDMDRTNRTLKVFKKLFMGNRHIPISVIFSSQVNKSETAPFIRQNSSMILLKAVSNCQLIDDYYNEYFSLYMNYEDFKKYYLENVIKKKYHSILIIRGSHDAILINDEYNPVELVFEI